MSGKLRAQRAKSMKFKDGYMISSGQPVKEYIDSAVRHVLLRQVSHFSCLVCWLLYCIPTIWVVVNVGYFLKIFFLELHILRFSLKYIIEIVTYVLSGGAWYQGEDHA